MVNRNLSISALLLLAAALSQGCSTASGINIISDGSKPYHLGRLSFSTPPGDGWQMNEGGTQEGKWIVFIKEGTARNRFMAASVVQVRSDSPVTSETELWDKVLLPYRDSPNKVEILTTRCESSNRFAKVGVLCYIEARYFRISNMGFPEAVTMRGHGYAFAFPDDSRMVGIIEYFEGGLPLDADTRKLLDKFARNVTLLK